METFVPKPFIGSFIPKDKHNDLNMWRFYGKEEGIDAKGCSITLNRQEFIEDIKNSLSNEKNEEARIDDESDINFYRVVYIPQKKISNCEFTVPKLNQNGNLKEKIDTLKAKVNEYKGNNKTRVEEYLNYIVF